MKGRTKNLIYDRLHKGFVLTSVAVTIGASIELSLHVYNYLTVVKPLQKQLEFERQQQLLKEGMDMPDPN